VRVSLGHRIGILWPGRHSVARAIEGPPVKRALQKLPGFAYLV